MRRQHVRCASAPEANVCTPRAPIVPGPAYAAAHRGLPAAAWICALVAFLNAAAWSLVTPAFQVPDEPSHFAYVQDLAETDTLPTSSQESFSPAEEIALRDLKQREVRYSPQNPVIFNAAEQRQLRHDLALALSRVGSGAGVAASEPPLYYALLTIPYFDGSSGTILDSLLLMRLCSALTAGLTTLFVFLFLREALPAARWTWTVGALGVGFAPLLGLMSGAVNPDGLLCAISAALFYCLARGFRRGLTPRLALLTGLVIAAGLLTKLSFIGLVAGAALGLVLLTLRAGHLSRGVAYRSLALASAAALAPVAVYVLVNELTGRSADGLVSSEVASAAAHGSALREMSYIWQFFLPRLPGMHDYFPGLSTTRRFWIDGFIGLYGWVDTVFPAWVYNIALIPLALLAALLARALITGRHALRHRGAELTVYATMTIGLMTLIGASDYREYPTHIGNYAQPRYLLPVIALYGAALALAARGAGRRWGPVAGTSIVALLIAHDVFSQLLEISRYYG
jgi:4-amino-4-deoxy-L-arabinose transferase-like glycosyltransferase